MQDGEAIRRKLLKLSKNLWWAWHPDVSELFHDIDADLWDETHHNPNLFLERITAPNLLRAFSDASVSSRLNELSRQLDHYLTTEDTYATPTAGKLRVWPVAYFSMEFGLHESLPTYAGGLGLLAGDHLKSASDLGVPMVGVGLLFMEGYFHQRINKEGWQEQVHHPLRIEDTGLEPVMTRDGQSRLTVDVPMPGGVMKLQIWRAQVGRLPLYLLDGNLPENQAEYRQLTGRLYEAEPTVRIRQEVILGVGGMRALAAVNQMPAVVHLNEGHCSFALLEMMRMNMAWEGASFARALDHVGRRAVFTTHTPVAAGHDRFPPALVLAHLDFIRREMGLSESEFLGLGRVNVQDANEPYCMTVLALKIAHRANGVSALHGRVSRQMWRPLWGGRPEPEVPIGHITNGVHVPGWLAPQMRGLYDRYFGPDWLSRHDWRPNWEEISRIPDEELWETHEILKQRLIGFLRRHIARECVERGDTSERIHRAQNCLSPNVLTIGFARRFAEYKRAGLIFHDVERLLRLIKDEKRPIQLIFSGKAHPANDAGKKTIQSIFNYAWDERFRDRVVFVGDYDIGIARQLVQGVDLWLNNPLRPLEASGTSGQKIIMNHGLNCSVLDGWWTEAYDGHNGFAIGYGGSHPDVDEQWRRDADALYRVLEEQVIPLYYERNSAGVPHKWLKMVKWAIYTLGWRFSANRMVMNYYDECYRPAAGELVCDFRGLSSLRDSH